MPSPYRTTVLAKLALPARTRPGSSWRAFVVVASWPVALVLFCALVRAFADERLMPGAVIYGAAAYAVGILVVCGVDLMRGG